jgi:hypothetical protein
MRRLQQQQHGVACMSQVRGGTDVDRGGGYLRNAVCKRVEQDSNDVKLSSNDRLMGKFVFRHTKTTTGDRLWNSDGRGNKYFHY